FHAGSPDGLGQITLGGALRPRPPRLRRSHSHVTGMPYRCLTSTFDHRNRHARGDYGCLGEPVAHHLRHLRHRNTAGVERRPRLLDDDLGVVNLVRTKRDNLGTLVFSRHDGDSSYDTGMADRPIEGTDEAAARALCCAGQTAAAISAAAAAAVVTPAGGLPFFHPAAVMQARHIGASLCAPRWIFFPQ